MNSTYTVVASPLGDLTLVASDGRLTGLYFPEQKTRPEEAALGSRDDAGLAAAVAQITEYFDGKRMSFDVPIRPRGSDFQQRVWAELVQIPYGETRSYRQLAERLGRPQLARAVGMANSSNPLSVIIPCHRVVGSNGRLTGYAGGLERKRELLRFEERTAAGAST